MQLMPTAEGEIGSVATVHFDADATARSISTRPRLVVETTGTAAVLLGDEATLTLRDLESRARAWPPAWCWRSRCRPGLHASRPAAELEYPVGDLQPGESRKLDLPLKAVQAGPDHQRRLRPAARPACTPSTASTWR